MSEEELLKKYGCNSLSEFIDTYLDCETAFDLLRSQFKEIERLNNIINEIEKWLEEDYNKTLMYEIADYPRYYLDTFKKILKGSNDNEENNQ